MSLSNKKVIIVEDDLILNLLYESYLERLGFKTEGELVYGKTAIKSVEEHEPDLIVMDISLEGDIDGIDAMLEIRKFSDVPVIFITGNSDPHHVERAEGIDYLDYLTKPIEFDDLQNVIQQHFPTK
ncbi:Response regulator receiver domain-containing protein [Fodinibius salinus]|uniref:Response regulator receiver domain-containing protein n=1 Tax=Fodinibius salinus TaxID=860790 RepID=A0A5D3YG90_9BACT|nr:response regulator [Fodinibius salinus]TYP92023.1 Response regulator receiver domain-containing protein [Fodinibius salinus]